MTLISALRGLREETLFCVKLNKHLQPVTAFAILYNFHTSRDMVLHYRGSEFLRPLPNE